MYLYGLLNYIYMVIIMTYDVDDIDEIEEEIIDSFTELREELENKFNIKIIFVEDCFDWDFR